MVREQILSPGMQNAEESNLGAQVLGIGGNLEQRLSADAEQQVIDDTLILER
jgi:hypothetical protein